MYKFMKTLYILSFLSLWRLFGWETHRQNMGTSSSNIERDSPGLNDGQCEVYVTRELYVFGICVDTDSHWETADCASAD
jgi:hypothetical protein